MSYQKIFTSIILLLIIGFQLRGQGENYALRNIIPPSATTASLGKYGEIPVGLYTGIPNISIPLYEIKDGPLSLPLSISYHAGGIKVEEIASAIGLGWTLNAGGIVGRNIRGRADEYGWVTDSASRIDTILQNGDMEDIADMTRDIDAGTRDGEGDMYYYNFDGHSGKFFFDQAGNLFNYPAKNIKVVPIAGDFGSAAGWRITVEDGTVYELNKAESVSVVTCGADGGEYITSWYLSKIKSADGKREISFTYENVIYSNQVFLGQTMYFPYTVAGQCITDDIGCLGTNTTYTHRLKRIDFNGGFVNFNYDSLDRADLEGERKLDQIEIYTSGNTLIKKYDFAYSYFGAGSANQYGKRLKLTSLTEKTATGQKPPHEFTYEESIVMPGRNSFAKDHWGYYNGQLSNTGLIPTIIYTDHLNGIPGTYTGNANREANPDSMQACILKRIKYPTGGETIFTFESNTVFDLRIAPKTYDSSYVFGTNQLFSSLTSPYESGTFTIPSLGADITFSVSGLNNSANCESFYWHLIDDNDSSLYSGSDNSINGALIHLTAGTYKFRFVFDCWQGSLNYSITLNAKIPVDSEYQRRPAGGLRLKQMEDKPGEGNPSIIKRYRYESASGASRGVLSTFPSYGYNLLYSVQQGNNEPSYSCYYVVQNSSTNYPLTTPQGSYVGYQIVTEDLGENGEIEHNYLTYTDPEGIFPFPPSNNYEWRKGMEMYTRYYAKKNGQLILTREVNNADTGVIKAVKRGYKAIRNAAYEPVFFKISSGSPVIIYYVTSEFHYIKQTRDRVYDQDDPSKFVETITDYTYDTTHFQLVRVRTSTSSKDSVLRNEVIVNKKYPQDYSFSGAASGSEAQGIKKLQDLHIVNVPIEEYTYRQKRNISTNAISDERVINGMITAFKSDNPYPDKVYRLETNTPISLATYGSGSGLSSNAFIKNTNSTIANAYKPAVVFNSYDAYGNLTMQQKANDVYTSYLWGYDSTYPVAQVVGATYSTISSLVNQSILDNPVSDLALRNELNNLRTGLTSPDVQVMTYTYKPLVGATSATDVNNRTTYYEYDDFGRLMLVRDQDKNIIQQICYNYAGQIENCNVYYNTAQSDNFIKDNCSSGYTGNSVTYTIPANTYSSPISVDSANAIAARAVQANGQNYANTYGGCTANINIYYWDYGYSGQPVYFTFTNLSTYQEFNFQTDPNQAGYHTVLGQLPPGNYEVDIYNPVDSWYHYYSIGCGYNASGYSYANCSFAHLEYDVNNICNTIVIDGN